MSSSFRTRLLLGVAGLVLAACATPAEQTGLRPALAAAPAPAAQSGDKPAAAEPAPEGSAYGLFLAGNAALKDGRGSVAAKYLSQLVAQDDAEPFLKERAFTASLLAGDIALAAKLAPGEGVGGPGSQRLGRMANAVEAMVAGRGDDAVAALGADMIGPPHGTAVALITPWAEALAGQAPKPVDVRTPDAPVADLLAKYGDAQLQERARKYKEAEAAFKDLYVKSPNVGIFGLGYGEFLERRGKRGEAVAVYDALLKLNPDNQQAKTSKARAQSRGKAPAQPNVQEGAAQALIALAANLVGRQQENSFVYLRLALRLDPTRNDAWVLLGDFLQQSGDVDAARQAFERVPTTAPEYLAARMRLAASYEAEDNLDQALKVARDTVAINPNDTDAQTLLANLLSTAKDYDGSVAILDKVIDRQGAKPNWRLYYLRAIAHERAGRWPMSEADLQKALALAPNQPEVLNYLGYSWADRGERLNDALEMLRKAVGANPNNGAMIDSLGWVYFRLGDYGRALGQLERAVALEPGDPDVNNHLGDVYWRVGRELEARFQWRRVLTLEPEPKLRAEVEEKLRNGLPAALKTAATGGGS